MLLPAPVISNVTTMTSTLVCGGTSILRPVSNLERYPTQALAALVLMVGSALVRLTMIIVLAGKAVTMFKRPESPILGGLVLRSRFLSQTLLQPTEVMDISRADTVRLGREWLDRLVSTVILWKVAVLLTGAAASRVPISTAAILAAWMGTVAIATPLAASTLAHG
jgi:hypothetical protein